MDTGLFESAPELPIVRGGRFEIDRTTARSAIAEVAKESNAASILEDCARQAARFKKAAESSAWFEKLDSPEAKERKAHAIQAADSMLRLFREFQATIGEKRGSIEAAAFSAGVAFGYRVGRTSLELDALPLERRADNGRKKERREAARQAKSAPERAKKTHEDTSRSRAGSAAANSRTSEAEFCQGLPSCCG